MYSKSRVRVSKTGEKGREKGPESIGCLEYVVNS